MANDAKKQPIKFLFDQYQKSKSILRGTVKTLYYVTRYNRIFSIQHKIAWNGSVPIKIPSL